VKIVLMLRRLRRIDDVEMRLSLAEITATLITFFIMGFVGPTMSNFPFGPYFGSRWELLLTGLLKPVLTYSGPELNRSRITPMFSASRAARSTALTWSLRASAGKMPKAALAPMPNACCASRCRR
jgi:hypothetical protein